LLLTLRADVRSHSSAEGTVCTAASESKPSEVTLSRQFDHDFPDHFPPILDGTGKILLTG